MFMLCIFVLVFYIYCQSLRRNPKSVDSPRSECTYFHGVTGLCLLSFVSVYVREQKAAWPWPRAPLPPHCSA
jgi:hypothetical protein